MKKILISIMFILSLSINSFANDLSNIFVVKIDEIITDSTFKIIDETIKKAELEKDALVLIELDTPGGILQSTRDIVASIMSSKVPVTVFVTPSGARAASAGLFITLSANFAVMAEGTNIGAAHPVNADGKDIEGEMAKKVENDTVAFITSIAEKRNRNIKFAVDAVVNSTSYTASQALKNGIIDKIVTEEENIFNIIKNHFKINNDLNPQYVERTFIQNIYKFLANPDILAALLFIGMLMIGLEFKMPSSFIFGGIGAVAFIIFAIGANIIPINFLAILLIVGGFVLLIAELFITSFGLLTISAIVSFLFGLRMLFDRDTSMGISVSPLFTVIITLLVASIAFLIGRLLVKDFKRKQVNGLDALIGKEAQVVDWQNNKGQITFNGEIWTAVGENISNNDTVVITSYNDMILSVEKVNKEY